MDHWQQVGVAALLRFTVLPVIVVAVLAVPLWLIRRYAPRLERWIYGPLYYPLFVIGRLAGRAIRRLVGRPVAKRRLPPVRLLKDRL